MWQRKKGTPQRRIDSLIGAGTVIHGNVSFSGGLRIDGQVRGNVTATNGDPAMLVLSEHARVEGEVHVSHVVINGTVTGPVTAEDHAELQPKAKITGDVAYRTLEMQLGAVVQGRLTHVEPGTGAVVEFRRMAADDSPSRRLAGLPHRAKELPDGRKDVDNQHTGAARGQETR